MTRLALTKAGANQANSKKFVKYSDKNQQAIVSGDCKCISIAAASIIAKVYRDEMMTKLSTQYQNYGWEQNKGYGTDSHRRAISKYGVTKLHRIYFLKKWVK